MCNDDFLNFVEKQDFIIFYLLCHIIKPKRNNKRKDAKNAEPTRKLSLQERRETFILRVEVNLYVTIVQKRDSTLRHTMLQRTRAVAKSF